MVIYRWYEQRYKKQEEYFKLSIGKIKKQNRTERSRSKVVGGGGVYGGRGCRQLKCVRVGRREQQMTRCSPSTSWKTSVGTEDDRADEERIFRSKNKIIFMFRVSCFVSVSLASNFIPIFMLYHQLSILICDMTLS